MRGNSRHFSGIIMRIVGIDAALDDALDEFDFISGMEVLSRNDISVGSGELTIQASTHAKQRIVAIAQKYHLSIAEAK